MERQEPQLSSRNQRYKKRQQQHFFSEVWSWIWSFAVSIVILAGLYFFVGKPFTVSGSSMYPTLHDGDRMVMTKLGDIHRFDVVVLQAPDENKEYIKRVIGMPGDRLDMHNGRLYINDQEVQQPFINQEDLGSSKTVFLDDFTLQSLTGETTVPEGKYFVMGDNRGVSRDSRIIGFIDRDAIDGKAVFTVWPLNRIGGLTDYSSLYTEQ